MKGIQLVLERGERRERGKVYHINVYHINGDAELTNIQLTDALLERCGAGWDMVARVEDRKGHDRRYSIGHQALRALGYAPRTRFGAGLTATVQWYQENRRWWEPRKRKADRGAGRPAAGVPTATRTRPAG